MITLKGSLYSAAVSSISGTTFVSSIVIPAAYMQVQRVVALFNSAGDFKGMAYTKTKSTTSATQETESGFFDPVTLAPVSFAAGDTYTLSFNFQDAINWAASGSGNGITYTGSGTITNDIVVSGKNITLTDELTLGADVDQKQICFYDTSKNISTSKPINFSGGVCVFGNLVDLQEDILIGECNFHRTIVSGESATNFGMLKAASSRANLFIFGGSAKSSALAYCGSQPNGASNSIVFDGVKFEVDVCSAGSGSAWAKNPTRHVLRNISAFQSSGAAILVRWGNGIVQGGAYRLNGGAISVFGSDAPGSFSLGAATNKRMKIIQAGVPNGDGALWRSHASATVQSVDYTNVISAKRTHAHTTGAASQPNNNITARFFYNDTFTNLLPGSKLVVRKPSGIESSVVVGASGTASVTLHEATVVGATETVHASSWTWGVADYDTQIASGSLATSQVSTIGGFAKNLAFYQLVNQTADPLVTVDRSSALGYTEINTPQAFYNRAKVFLCENYAGEVTTIVTREGGTINAGTYNVTIDASATSVFAFDGSTITIKATSFVGNIVGSGTFTLLNGAEILGTFGSTTVYSWQIANIEAGSTLQLFNVTQNAQIENLVVSGTAGTKVSASGSYATAEASTGDTIRLRLTCQAGTSAMLPFETFGVATASGLSLRADQTADAVYNANNIDGSAIIGISLTPDYANIQIDLDDQVAPYEITAQEIYNYYAYLITTPQGIANFFGAVTPIDRLNYRINTAVVPLKLQNTGNTDVVLNGGRLYRDDNISVIDTGAGSGSGSLMQDTGMLIQYLQPQVESALGSYGVVTTAALAATETSLKKKITQAALL